MMDAAPSAERVPDFVVIGAAKAGTTSLHHYLGAHPDIFMSSPLKEPRLFLGLDVAHAYWSRKRGITFGSQRELLTTYMLDGYAGERLFGESTADYTVGDMSLRHDIPRRMKAANPAMKLIYVVRNPFARIVSNHLHLCRLADRSIPPLRAIDFAADPHGRIMATTSLYFRQLEHYLDHFTKDSIHILIFEELIADPRATLSTLFRFLGVADDVYREESFPIHNASANRHELPSDSLRFSAAGHRALRRLFDVDIQAMEGFIGRSIDCWCLSAQEWAGGKV